MGKPSKRSSNRRAPNYNLTNFLTSTAFWKPSCTKSFLVGASDNQHFKHHISVPIKRHIYHLFCRESIRNASFETLTNNLSLVRTFSMDKLGLPSNVKTPDMKQLELVRKYMRKAQNHYSPLKKFENILSALSLLVRRADSFKKLPCTDVIRWFVYLLAKTSCVTCEIEAWYM